VVPGDLLSRPIAAALVLAAGVGLGLGRAGDEASSRLWTDAFSFSRANGESAPDQGFIVSGNRREVVAATMGGAQVGTDQPVFVVRLRGNFVGYEAPVPAGLAPPHGHYLEIVYDADTNQMTDWNIAALPQDLTRLRA
jgi:hypothetical protein